MSTRVVLAALLLTGVGCRPAPSPSPPPASPSPSPLPTTSPRQAEGPPALIPIGTFDQPIFVSSPPGDRRLFVVEKGGRIRIVSGGRKLSVPFLDISREVSDGFEQGLFSIAFAPDYGASGLAYVHYTNRSGDTRLVEYRVSPNPNRLAPASARPVLAVDQPFANHNGGGMVFGPGGHLYLGLGDGGSGGDPGNRAQNLSTLLGKILRIDPGRPSGGGRYSVPEDNPFFRREGARREIWGYGLRNPWRFSFDAQGNLWVGDVGQNRYEEIDFVPPAGQAGANYGWRAYEGAVRFTQERIDESRLVRPIHTYPLDGTCAVTGGYLYRGSVASLRGTYVFGDFCEGVLKGFRESNGRASGFRTFDNLKAEQLASFAEDSRGELYVISLAGRVYRIG